MLTIKFTDGKQMTNLELAAEIRAEGRLGTKNFETPDGRCAQAVIENVKDGIFHRSMSLQSWIEFNQAMAEVTQHTYLHAYPGYPCNVLNDKFEGTPEERAEYFAGLLEDL